MSAWRCTNSAYASSSPRVARATSSASSSGGPPRSDLALHYTGAAASVPVGWPSGDQHGASADLAALEPAQRGGGLLERKRLAQGPDLAGCGDPQHLAHLHAVADHRADDALVVEEGQFPEISVDAEHDRAPAAGGAQRLACQRVRRSEEDARIDATVTAQRVAGVDRRRVDDAFGSQLARELEMQCAAYDGDDVGAGKARKLRHHVTDATESEDSDALTG